MEWGSWGGVSPDRRRESATRGEPGANELADRCKDADCMAETRPQSPAKNHRRAGDPRKGRRNPDTRSIFYGGE